MVKRNDFLPVSQLRMWFEFVTGTYTVSSKRSDSSAFTLVDMERRGQDSKNSRAMR
jgi:hypothetical protein